MALWFTKCWTHLRLVMHFFFHLILHLPDGRCQLSDSSSSQHALSPLSPLSHDFAFACYASAWSNARSEEASQTLYSRISYVRSTRPFLVNALVDELIQHVRINLLTKQSRLKN